MKKPRREFPPTEPRRRRMLTKGQQVAATITGFGVVVSGLVVAAVVPDAWTRTVDSVLSVFAPAPAPEMDTYPAPFNAEKQFSGMVIPGTPQEIGDPPGAWNEDVIVQDDDILRWARPLGGVDFGSTTVTFSLTSADTIVVEGLEVRVTERRPALVGSYVSVQGGGDLWSRVYQVNLDDDALVVQTDMGDDGDWNFPISIGPSDTYVAEVVGEAERTDTSWVIDIHYVSDGQRRTATFDDDGEPFRTTGSTSVEHHWVWSEGWVDGPPW